MYIFSIQEFFSYICLHNIGRFIIVVVVVVVVESVLVVRYV